MHFIKENDGITFGRTQKNTYLCNMFFMVLDY